MIFFTLDFGALSTLCRVFKMIMRMNRIENVNFLTNKLTKHILIITSIILIPHEVGWRRGMKFIRRGSQVCKIVSDKFIGFCRFWGYLMNDDSNSAIPLQPPLIQYNIAFYLIDTEITWVSQGSPAQVRFTNRKWSKRQLVFISKIIHFNLFNKLHNLFSVFDTWK